MTGMTAGLVPGSRLDRYELLSPVLQGATSTLWIARVVRTTTSVITSMRALDRVVAIKTFAPHLAIDAGFREALLNEVCPASSVFHPNVVQIIDLGDHDDQLYIVTEWIDGDSLMDVRWALEKKGQRIPAGIVLRVLADVCAGLHATHQLRDRANKPVGLAHGEVSPANILISVAGVAKLINLGVAKSMGALPGWPPPVVDRNADVAAVGALLDTHLAPKSLAATPPVSAIAELLERARATDVRERFATAAEMQGAIERAMIALGASTTNADVAAYVSEHLGEQAAARNARIEAALNGDVARPSISSTIPAAAHTVSPPPSPEATTQIQPAKTSRGVMIDRALRLKNRFQRATPLAMLAMALAGVGLFAATGQLRHRPPPSAAPSPVVAAGAPQVAPLARRSCPDGMVLIPGGKFFMGSDDDLAVERPAHQVTISAYCIDVYEVTTAQYKACSDSGDCKRASTVNTWGGISEGAHQAFDALCNERDPVARGYHPINCVDWEMAKSYCARGGGHLPTEAEWELAARGPDGRRYPWGDEAPSEMLLNACGKECVAWGKANGVELEGMYATDDAWPTTAPVGSFPAGKSRYGVQDLVGNVWEWVADWYGDYSPEPQVEPKGPSSGDARVIRGGAWNGTQPSWVRPAFRTKNPPDTRSHGVGFRCAHAL